MVKANLHPGYELAQRLRKTDRAIVALSSQPVLQNASSTQSDGSLGLNSYVRPTGGAKLDMHYGPNTPGATQDANGQWPIMFTMGQSTNPATGVPVGSAVEALRPDGSAIMFVGYTTGGFYSGFNVIDKSGNIVVSCDEASGFGVADPWIPYPTPLDTNVSKWPGTASGTLTNISNSNGVLQHPKMTFTIQGYAPAAVTGLFALYVNGVQVGSTWTATGAVVATVQTVTIASPVWHAGLSLQVFAQVTAGAGTVRAQVTQIYGRQT